MRVASRVFLSTIGVLSFTFYTIYFLLLDLRLSFGVGLYFMTDLMMNLDLILEDIRLFCGIGIGVDGGLLTTG